MGRLNIAFFTPLAPLQTALSDHSEGLLPYLARDANISLFIDEGYRPTSPNIVDQFAIYSYQDFPWRATDYDLNVYVMGDNLSFHGYMHNLMAEYPGIVILHDTNFQHYFLARALQLGDPGIYQAEMEYAYGAAGRRVAALAHAGKIDRLRGPYPLVECIVDWSLGAVVYNEFAYNDLLMRRPHARVQCLDYHFYLPPGFPAEVDVQAMKRRWGLDGCFIIGTFGLFIPDKRIDVCLRVFERFLDIRPDARYLLVGGHSPYYDVPGLIRSHGLEDRVTLTGWMGALEFAQHLRVPDIVLHLRYPHIGGTLYTPIRLLGLGQPTILSDIEPLNDFPEGCCAKIAPDEYEEDTLLEVLVYLAEHEDRRRQMGDNGRQFMRQHHDATQIARKHLDFFEHVASSDAKPTAERTPGLWDGQLVRETAAILAEWGVTEQDDELLQAVTAAIAGLSIPT
jgi:glycosyltransferase involved in cell wall biosynthesis